MHCEFWNLFTYNVTYKPLLTALSTALDSTSWFSVFKYSILLLNLTKNSNLWLGPRLFKTLDRKFSNYFWSNFPLNGKFWIQIYKSNKIWLDIKRFVLKFGWINRLLRSGFCHTFYLTFRMSIPKLNAKMSRLFNNLSSR